MDIEQRFLSTLSFSFKKYDHDDTHGNGQKNLNVYSYCHNIFFNDSGSRKPSSGLRRGLISLSSRIKYIN